MTAILISAFLLSLSACLDNIVVGIAYGMKRTKIGLGSNLLIAIITSCGTLISMLFGRLIATVLPVTIAQNLGASMIILIGIYFILEYCINKNKNNANSLPDIVKEDICCNNNTNICDRKIGLRETIMLAFALTINNLGIGISASLAGVNISATVILTFLISLITIILGVAMGYNVIGRICGKYAGLVSGILMIILGIFEILG